MIRWIAWLFLTAAAPGIAGPVDGQPVRTVEPGTSISWSWSTHEGPARYRVGDLLVVIRGETSGEDPETMLVRPVVTVEAPGQPPVTIEGGDTRPTYSHLVTFGRWESGRPYVMLQSFTGGAHCCNEVQLVVPHEGRLAAVHFGSWDGDYAEDLPSDLDGDGRIDFVFLDNSFLYAFASYADSYAPPLVLNVVDSAIVDVSARPGFRLLFEAALPDQRRACVSPEVERPRNGACAAFVATAARAGRFDQAWAEMLAAYDRASDWDLPDGCRSAASPCPAAEIVRFTDFPSALRHFLARQGYITP